MNCLLSSSCSQKHVYNWRQSEKISAGRRIRTWTEQPAEMTCYIFQKSSALCKVTNIWKYLLPKVKSDEDLTEALTCSEIETICEMGSYFLDLLQFQSRKSMLLQHFMWHKVVQKLFMDFSSPSNPASYLLRDVNIDLLWLFHSDATSGQRHVAGVKGELETKLFLLPDIQIVPSCSSFTLRLTVWTGFRSEPVQLGALKSDLDWTESVNQMFVV